MPPSLSVVVPTYNRCDSVARLLRSLDRQTLPAEQFEVVVVIDGSEDGTRELVAERAAAYALQAIWQPNQKRAAACNTGVRAATGEVVLILDDDMEAAPGLAAAHLAAHAVVQPRGSVGPVPGLAAHAVVQPWDSVGPAPGRAAHAGSEALGVVGPVPMQLPPAAPPAAHYMSRRYERLSHIFEQPAYDIPPGEFYGGNFSVPRQTLLEAGLFDAQTFVDYGAEDMDLAERLRQMGVRLRYCAQAVAYQHYQKDLSALTRDVRAEGRAEVALLGKHPALWAGTRLSQFGQAPALMRAGRGLLLGLARVWPGFPNRLASGLAWLEAHSRPWPERAYTILLGYWYWLGALEAMRANRRAGRGWTQPAGGPETGEATQH